MGTLGGGNGGNVPPDGSGRPDDLPNFPPEWGVVVIPDTPAELADVAAQVRRELRWEARRRRWRRRLRLPPAPPRRPDEAGLGVPLLVVSIAVLATIVSLFTVAWPGPAGQAQLQPTPATVATLPADASVVSRDGTPLRVRDTLPAVILLVEGCACETLIAEAAAVTTTSGRPVGLLAVGGATPPATPPGKTPAPGDNVWVAADPDRALRSAVPGLAEPRAPAASALLVDAAGRVLRVLPTVTSVADLRTEIDLL